MKGMDVEVKQLDPIGAEIVGADIEQLLNDYEVPGQVMELLEKNGVMVFRALGLDDAQLAGFGRRLGETVKKQQKGWSQEYPDVFTVAMDEERKAGAYMKGTFGWHIDGTPYDIPSKASLLTGRALPSSGGGNTEFASTYEAYDRLSDEEKERFGTYKVWHSLEVTLRRSVPDAGAEDLARAKSEMPKLHPMVWTHRSGRKSLVIGNTAGNIEGLSEEEGEALLEAILERSTRPEHVYSHKWTVGDLVIWDNRGVIHRASPYEVSSGREMHRVTLVGDEAVQ
jgi:alpha-ketoglutarate-dependent taurine dioxygenase